MFWGVYIYMGHFLQSSLHPPFLQQDGAVAMMEVIQLFFFRVVRSSNTLSSKNEEYQTRTSILRVSLRYHKKESGLKLNKQTFPGFQKNNFAAENHGNLFHPFFLQFFFFKERITLNDVEPLSFSQPRWLVKHLGPTVHYCWCRETCCWLTTGDE